MPTIDDIRERYAVREALREPGRSSAEDDPEFLFTVQVYHFQLHMRIAGSTRCRPLVELIEQTHVLIFNWVWDLAARHPALPPRFIATWLTRS
jgi:hypothetical protein